MDLFRGTDCLDVHALKIYALQSASNHLLHGMGYCRVAIFNPVIVAFLVHQPQREGKGKGDQGRGGRRGGGGGGAFKRELLIDKYYDTTFAACLRLHFPT